MAHRWSRYISNIETFHNKYIEVFLWILSNTSCQTLSSGTYSESSRHPEWIVGTDQLIVIFNSMASCWMCLTTADPFFEWSKKWVKNLVRSSGLPYWQVPLQDILVPEPMTLHLVVHMVRWRHTLATNTEVSQWKVPHNQILQPLLASKTVRN